jgi:hypothetical protein
MSSTVTTATVAAVTGLLAVCVLVLIAAVLIVREVTVGSRAASIRRFRSGLVLCLVPLACLAGLTMAVDKRTINQLTPADSQGRERILAGRSRIQVDPAAAFIRVDLTRPPR